METMSLESLESMMLSSFLQMVQTLANAKLTLVLQTGSTSLTIPVFVLTAKLDFLTQDQKAAMCLSGRKPKDTILSLVKRKFIKSAFTP